MKQKLKMLVTGTGLVAVLAFSIASCKRTNSERPDVNYSDREIAKGILFLSGKVSNAIPELKDAGEYVEQTVKSRVGETEYAKLQSKQSIMIEKLLDVSEELSPGFLRDFKTAMTSKNPQRITESIASANKLIYTAVLYKSMESSATAVNGAKSAINEAVFTRNKDLKALVSEIKSNQIKNTDIQLRVENILGKDAGVNYKPIKTTAEGECALLAIALNIGAFVNIGMILNVVALVNIEVGFNVHQAAAITKYTAITSEFQHESSSTAKLDKEMIAASIARTL